MSPEALWNRYAATWSRDSDARVGELAACLADDVTYCDPNGPIEGRLAISAYMSDFQQSVPGGTFRIRTLLHHHDRTLAHWSLHGPDNSTLQTGTSFGLLSDDGRLRSITGFFYRPDQDQDQPT
ncbi:SnoaL-like protein [Paraburkholderia sp. BL23I1N1]|uniref:nuclear transport factor 2 family protein n=1 Tax=Paraburkholderia sp. BL23I1N1 TaxID=1938802 RepID=UPI000E7726EB|nr:nuclear transport factor 2 family protein [Paraburkholderia sp. BL23I1N1]RKE37423.1 SnoaL-like protein [Paraburkholderia sp. BL23I1N1]